MKALIDLALKRKAEQQRVEDQLRADLKAGKRNLDGSHVRPEWESMLDPATGMIKNQYSITNDVNAQLAGNKGFAKFEGEALRDGPSAYAKLLMDQQDLDRQDQLDDINAQYNMGMQSSLDSLASQGGLYGGARERMGANSIRDMLAARQGARQDYNRNRLGIQAEDERNRIGQLQALTGLENNRNQMYLSGREFDLRNSMNEFDAKRKDNFDAWKINQETWASNKQADAQAKAAGGGCFPQGTMIEMNDGSKKAIEEIEIGDHTFGGKVTKIMKGSAIGSRWYDYCGTLVTGDHAVLENGQFVRVKDSDRGELMQVEFDHYYNLANEQHILLINDQIFSDMDEHDDVSLGYTEALKKKNEEQCLKSIS